MQDPGSHVKHACDHVLLQVTSYVHGATELLGVQIDAAINSGNSGGSDNKPPVSISRSFALQRIKPKLLLVTVPKGLILSAFRIHKDPINMFYCRWPCLQRSRPGRGHCLPVICWGRCREHWVSHTHKCHPPFPDRLQVGSPGSYCLIKSRISIPLSDLDLEYASELFIYYLLS